MFIQKPTGHNFTYRFLQYNPNYGSELILGNKIMKEFKAKHKNLSYTGTESNEKGACTKLAWTEIVNCIIHDIDPFKVNTIYPYCRAAKAYWTKKDVNIFFKGKREYDSARYKKVKKNNNKKSKVSS